MIRTTIVALSFLALTLASATAGHCPKDAAAIDAAVGKANLSEDQRNQVMSLRDEGMQLHEAGDHRESESKLAEAMRIILNSL